MTIRVLSVLHDTTVDGPGFRTSIYCAGCGHHCPGCHNPQSWDFDGGEERNVDDLMAEITEDPFADVTFTGGDPLYQAAAFTELARRIKQETNKNIWCYTGFLFEDIRDKAQLQELFNHIDVIVDGRFDLSQRNEDLPFRGSANQRIIDVQKSLREDNIVMWKRT
jgi:anaerobic ribonucleoside-triphosphate reductase activating protein